MGRCSSPRIRDRGSGNGQRLHLPSMNVRRRAAGLVAGYSTRRRLARGEIFRRMLSPSESDRILDLGSEEGDHIAALVSFRDNVTISDIDPEALRRGAERFGFQTAELDESGRLPFRDGHFDIVFCSSVIEHVTVAKEEIGEIRSGESFQSAAWNHQQQFAAEIRRVSKRYFVQTPNKWFPIESHTWLPMPIVVLPRRLQLRVVGWLNRWWIKPTQVDWNLLTQADMQILFPDALIIPERSLGMCKSLIAVKSD
jgi:hypothetical protein